MKATLVLEQFVNPANAPEYLQSQILYKFGLNPHGDVVPIAYLPVGTVFEGDQAVFMCRTGQCSPADDECAKASGKTPDQIAAQQVEYKMNTLGINRAEDRELYRAGVITGYDADLKYIHGPNWDKYQKAKEALKKESDDI